MRRFNAAALYDALEAERQRRGLTWSELARETGVAAATMQRLKQGGRLEVDGALAMVGWLGRAIEDFTDEAPF